MQPGIPEAVIQTLTAERDPMSVEVAQQQNFSAMMKCFAVDVQQERDKRVLRERAFSRPAWPSQIGR
jgi:hypothetical protein